MCSTIWKHFNHLSLQIKDIFLFIFWYNPELYSYEKQAEYYQLSGGSIRKFWYLLQICHRSIIKISVCLHIVRALCFLHTTRVSYSRQERTNQKPYQNVSDQSHTILLHYRRCYSLAVRRCNVFARHQVQKNTVSFFLHKCVLFACHMGNLKVTYFLWKRNCVGL